MEFEFDKEIDSLMRQMAKGEVVTKNLPDHLDADELSGHPCIGKISQIFQR